MIYGVNAGNGSMSKLYRSVQGGSYATTDNTTLFTVPDFTQSVIRSILVSEYLINVALNCP